MAGLGFRLLIVMAPAVIFCAEPNRSWDTLMGSVRPGTTIVVTRMNSAQFEGKLAGITAESITVRWHGQPQFVPREEVYRVRIANIRRRHTLVGMAIGASGGVILGAVATRNTIVSPAAGAVLFGLMGAGAGAAAGGALPLGTPLYQAAGPPQRATRLPRQE